MHSLKCKGKVELCTRDGHRYTVKCGHFDSSMGGEVLCAPCEKAARKRYPQGWAYYPGDTCKHGTYVGGCGVDHMCHRCEME